MHDGGLFSPELTSDIPRIVMTGKKLILVEQHRGLVSYQQDEVSLKTSIGLLKLQGTELRFRHYTATEAVICGEITHVFLMEGVSK